MAMGTIIKNARIIAPGGKIILGNLKCEEGKIVSISQEELLPSERIRSLMGKVLISLLDL